MGNLIVGYFIVKHIVLILVVIFTMFGPDSDITSRLTGCVALIILSLILLLILTSI